MGGLDSNPRTHFQRQYLLLVGGILLIEHAGRRHGYHTYLATLGRQLLVSIHRQTNL